MTFRTHITISAYIGAAVGLASGLLLNFGFLGGVYVGTLLPDIDEPRSTLGRFVPSLAQKIKDRWGHRGYTHTLLAAAVTCIGIAAIPYLPRYFHWGILVGYLSHLFGDWLTPTGIPLLSPFRHTALAARRTITTFPQRPLDEAVSADTSAALRWSNAGTCQ